MMILTTKTVKDGFESFVVELPRMGIPYPGCALKDGKITLDRYSNRPDQRSRRDGLHTSELLDLPAR